MTIRDKLNKTYKKCAVFEIFSGTCLAISILKVKFHQFDLLTCFFFVSLLLFVAGGFFLRYGIRCPKCNKAIGGMLEDSTCRPLKIIESLKICPNCGVDFDSEI